MSVAIVVNDQSEEILRLFAQPRCGEDFCDGCGDCLYCYDDDACPQHGMHQWVIYADQAEQFLRDHPEATPVEKGLEAYRQRLSL